jgi:hypothetical protein
MNLMAQIDPYDRNWDTIVSDDFNETTPLWEASVARNYPMIGDSLSHWHTYACEWMPEYIKWYCDGHVVNEMSKLEARTRLLSVSPTLSKSPVPSRRIAAER